MIHFSIKVVYPCKSIQIDGLGASCGSKLLLVLSTSQFLQSHLVGLKVKRFFLGFFVALIACDSRSVVVDMLCENTL